MLSLVAAAHGTVVPGRSLGYEVPAQRKAPAAVRQDGMI